MHYWLKLKNVIDPIDNMYSFTRDESVHPHPIWFDDETLRDGLQSPSARNPRIEEKIELLDHMENLGIQKVDLGLPGAGPFHVDHIDAMLAHIKENEYQIRPGCAVRTVVADIEPMVELQAKHEIELENLQDRHEREMERINQQKEKEVINKQIEAEREMQRSFTFGMKSAMEDYVDEVTNGAEQARRAFENSTRKMEDAIVNFAKTGKFEFKQLINDMLEALLRSRIQELFARIFSGGKTSSGGTSALGEIFGKIGDGIKNIFGGFFANGGTLGAGKFGIAGERGPEIVSGPAQITPMTAGAEITYNINAVDARSFQELVASDPQFLFAVTETGRQSLPETRR